MPYRSSSAAGCQSTVTGNPGQYRCISAGLGLQKTRRQIAKTGQMFDEWNADANPHLVDVDVNTVKILFSRIYM